MKSRFFLFGLVVGGMLVIPFSGCARHEPPTPVVINMPSDTAPEDKNTGTGDAFEPERSQGEGASPVMDEELGSGNATHGEPATASSHPVSHGILQMDPASFFNTQVHDMAVQLIENFRDESGPQGAIAVATFVDLNHLYRTSPFGRYLAEQLMGELQRAGLQVVDVRKTNALLIKEHYGEYSLSRDIQEIARQSSAQYVLVGTYVTRGEYVLINSRLVSNQGNLLVSSGMKILRKDPFIAKMLWPAAEPAPAPGVKMPVKKLGEADDVRIIPGS